MATRKTIDWDSLTEEERCTAASDVGLQDFYLDMVADNIAAGKNLSPDLIARCLRNLVEVNIPSEILEYVADFLEGKNKRKGKPMTSINMTLKETQSAFARMDFDELVSQGMTAEDALRRLACDQFKGEHPGEHPSEDQIETMVNRISNLVYPRKRKAKGTLNRD